MFLSSQIKISLGIVIVMKASHVSLNNRQSSSLGILKYGTFTEKTHLGFDMVGSFVNVK